MKHSPTRPLPTSPAAAVPHTAHNSPSTLYPAVHPEVNPQEPRPEAGTATDTAASASEQLCCETCHSVATCGRDVLDALLRDRRLQEFPEALDALLDFRTQLTRFQGGDPERVLRAFVTARRTAESSFYLLFFRLRCWLEKQFEVEVWDTTGHHPAERHALRIGGRGRSVDALLIASRHHYFEHTADPVRYEDITAAIRHRSGAGVRHAHADAAVS